MEEIDSEIIVLYASAVNKILLSYCIDSSLLSFSLQSEEMSL